MKSKKPFFFGAVCPVSVTRHTGRAEYPAADEASIQADEFYAIDYGPKYGTARVYIRYPENERPEQQSKLAEAIKKTAGQVMLGNR